MRYAPQTKKILDEKSRQFLLLCLALVLSVCVQVTCANAQDIHQSTVHEDLIFPFGSGLMDIYRDVFASAHPDTDAAGTYDFRREMYVDPAGRYLLSRHGFVNGYLQSTVKEYEYLNLLGIYSNTISASNLETIEELYATGKFDIELSYFPFIGSTERQILFQPRNVNGGVLLRSESFKERKQVEHYYQILESDYYVDVKDTGDGLLKVNSGFIDTILPDDQGGALPEFCDVEAEVIESKNSGDTKLIHLNVHTSSFKEIEPHADLLATSAKEKAIREYGDTFAAPFSSNLTISLQNTADAGERNIHGTVEFEKNYYVTNRPARSERYDYIHLELNQNELIARVNKDLLYGTCGGSVITIQGDKNYSIRPIDCVGNETREIEEKGRVCRQTTRFLKSLQAAVRRTSLSECRTTAPYFDRLLLLVDDFLAGASAQSCAM